MEWQSAGSNITKDQTGLTNDEKIASLFQPDTLMSAQYFENLRRRTVLEPEKSLMLAILEDAVRSYQENLLSRQKRAKKLFEDAAEWIAETGSEWIFSFESVCDALGLNPAYVRRGCSSGKRKIDPNNLSANRGRAKGLRDEFARDMGRIIGN